MYGAEVHLVSREDGGFKGALEMVEDFAEEIGAYKPLQFDNELNVEAQYVTTGQEIIDKIPAPKGDDDGKLQALIFDSYYDNYKGAVCLVRIKNGIVK